MRLRGLAKQVLYGARPFYKGAFPYYMHAVHFPRGSHIFQRTCSEGVYEREVVQLVTGLVLPQTTYIDVGANIGLLSIPVLMEKPDAKVISVEASPDTLRYLEHTRSKSAARDRWTVVGTAVGRAPGSATFWISKAENGAFDGFRNTGRGGEKQSVTVPVTTLDTIWRSAGSPRVSCIKIDVEGAEAEVIAGAAELIRHERPALVIEWSPYNLPSYGIAPEYLLEVCGKLGYRVFAHPQLALVDNATMLAAAMAQTETFLLVPEQAAKP